MFAFRIDCRDRMTCRPLGQLDTPVEQERADTDEESIGSLVCKRSERRIDLADGAGFENLNLHAHRLGRTSTPRNVDSVVVELIGSTSTSIRTAFGKRPRRSSSRFVTTSATRILIPVRLPSGFARLLTRPSFTESSPAMNRTGMDLVSVFAARPERKPPPRRRDQSTKVEL